MNYGRTARVIPRNLWLNPFTILLLTLPHVLGVNGRVKVDEARAFEGVKDGIEQTGAAFEFAVDQSGVLVN